MGMKEKQRNAYRSMQGKEVDLHKLIMQNEMTVAVGNIKVNARGDELGPGGKIVRKREDVLREAQNSTPDQRTIRKDDKSLTPSTTPVATRPARKNINDKLEGNDED